MSIKGIYNADGKTTYTVEDTKAINNKFVGGKVVYGELDLEVAAQVTPNMSVKVAAGWCSIDGAFLQNTSSYKLDIVSNTSNYARIDVIAAYISGTTYDLRVLQGTANSNPVAPTVTSNHVKLAEIYVGSGVTAIQTNNITDFRGKNDQSIITSIIDKVFDIENLISILGNESNPLAALFSKEKPSGGKFPLINGYYIVFESKSAMITTHDTKFDFTYPFESKHTFGAPIPFLQDGAATISATVTSVTSRGFSVRLFSPGPIGAIRVNYFAIIKK